MSTWKHTLAAVVILAGVSGSAQAQGFAGYVGYAAYPTVGIYGDNYGYGYGSYPIYGGSGYAGYFMPGYTVPRTYNNMGGLMDTITRQTGRPGSYRNGSNVGISRTRRGR